MTEHHSDDFMIVGDEPDNRRTAIEDQLAEHVEAMKSEREEIFSTLTTNGRLLERLSIQRILLVVILAYLGGLLTMPVLREILSFVGLVHSG